MEAPWAKRGDVERLTAASDDNDPRCHEDGANKSVGEGRRDVLLFGGEMGKVWPRE